MTLWCRRLPTCTRQTGASTRQLRGAGPRNTPWASEGCHGCDRKDPFPVTVVFKLLCMIEDVWLYPLLRSTDRERFASCPPLTVVVLFSVVVWKCVYETMKQFLLYPCVLTLVFQLHTHRPIFWQLKKFDLQSFQTKFDELPYYIVN